MTYRVRLAIERPALSMTACYNYMRAENPFEAAARAIRAAEAEFGVRGWVQDGPVEPS
jgi:hypothetical protein